MNPEIRNPERSLWCAVVLAVLADLNAAWCRAVRKGRDTEPVLAEARQYFSSSDGRAACACAGIDISPDQAVACIAVNHLAFRSRMTVLPTTREDAA